MKNYTCDHCGKKLDTYKDYIDDTLDIWNTIYYTDLCEECRNKLAQLVDETVENFINKKEIF